MSRTDAPLSYAVVIPAFNAARTIHEAISSVFRQTAPPAAVIVIDDGSVDETAAIVKSFGDRVALVTQYNQGPAVATDRGMALVQTPIIAGLDADDVWFSDKAERQLSFLISRPDLDAVFCRSVNFKHGEMPDPGAPARDAWGRSAMMIRRSAAESMGPIFDAGNPRGLGEMMRWLDLGRRRNLQFAMMPETLFGRRLIDGSLSSARDPRSFLPLIRGKLAQRSPPAEARTGDRAKPSSDGQEPA